MTSMRLARLLVVIGVLVTAGCGSAAAPQTGPARPREAPSAFAGAELSPPVVAPPLALRDASGRPTTLAQQRGRYVLVTFLYTHCPDVCPLIASSLNTALRTLGRQRDEVRVLAVSVDPRGDTPASVREYMRRMHLLPQWRYLIGSRPELVRAWRAYHVLAVARKAELVDHVAYTALIDRRGRERVLYDSQVHAPDVVHDLRRLLAHESRA